jgi:hypothetical protein
LAQPTQILVIESNILLGESILSLLDGQPELEVTHTQLSSLASMVEMNGQQPGVVIIEEEHLLANMSAFIQYTDRHPNLRLIVLALNENKIHVFDKQMVEVRQVSDFLGLLFASEGQGPAANQIGEMPGGE